MLYLQKQNKLVSMKTVIYILKNSLVAIFLIVVLETVIRTHTHIIDNQLITHSHPFSKPQSNHTHNSVELSIILQLNTITTLALFTLVLLSIFKFNHKFIFSYSKKINNYIITLYYQLRAPPTI